MLIPGLNTWFSLHFQYLDYSVDLHIYLMIFGRSFASLNTFILVHHNLQFMGSCNLCRMSLISVNPQRGIIVRVKREKRFEISFLICVEQLCTLRRIR